MFQLVPRLRNPTARFRPRARLRPHWNLLVDSIRANHSITGSSSSHPQPDELDCGIVNGNAPLGSSCDPAVTGDERDNGSATTGRLVTLRTFLVHALKLQSPIVQLDLKSAFHHLLPPEDSSERSEDTPTYSAQVSTSGPKWTSPSRCKAIATWLEVNQLKQSKSDPCLLLGHQFHVFFLSDSILVIGDIENFKSQILSPRFSIIPNLHEVDTVLGIQIRRRGDQHSLYLSQSRQICKALSELKILNEDTQDILTPLTPKLHLVEAGDEDHEKFLEKGFNYRQSIGLLNHIASNTRPDVSYASSSLAQFTEKPGISHWMELERCWKYLKASEDKALELKINETDFDLEVWSDANWAGDPTSRKSQSGYLACLHGSCISWNSARQGTVSLSSTESELRALVEATQELVWLQQLIKELNTLSPKNTKKTTHMSYIDNNPLACLLANSSFHSKTKHIDVQTKWLREHVQSNILSYQWIPTKSMPADCLTKPAPKSSYSLLCSKISLL